MAVHPSSVKNTFGRHFVFWVFFLPLLSIIFLPLISADQNIDEGEVQMVKAFNVDMDKLSERANGTFTRAFVATGAMGASEAFFAGKGTGQAGAGKNGMATKWIRGVWLMVYKTIWRWYALLWIFFVPMVALSIPAAVDGFTVRARKRYRFETSNPVFFYSSTHALTLVLGLFFFLPLAPMTLSAIVLFGMLVALAVAVWVAASNFQTGA